MSAPLAADSDFTLEDPLALDYLAQQVGNWLFAGITTRTARPQNYAVVLYGLYLADRCVHERAYPGDDKTRASLFERWERLWALATLESRNGALVRGDRDAMRGVRGAQRSWFPGSRPLPLDFQLISRQTELGGLGAYLSSLRTNGLVFPGSLRPTPAARPILESFWGEASERNWNNSLEEFAFAYMDLEIKKVGRKRGRVPLAMLGKRSRLSCIRDRPEQQERLWEALFLRSRDASTLPLALAVVEAAADGVTETLPLLEGLLEKRWGNLPDTVLATVELALCYGHIDRILLDRFNQAYGHVDGNGWVADFRETARAAFPPEGRAELAEAMARLLACREASRFRGLAFHGPALMRALADIPITKPERALGTLLQMHRSVQRSRRGGGSWLRIDGTKLVMQVAGYNGYKQEATYPSFKFDVVQTLLHDLGKLP